MLTPSTLGKIMTLKEKMEKLQEIYEKKKEGEPFDWDLILIINTYNDGGRLTTNMKNRLDSWNAGDTLHDRDVMFKQWEGKQPAKDTRGVYEQS